MKRESLRAKDCCPATGKFCDLADICTIFWCAKSTNWPQRAKPKSYKEMWPLATKTVTELKALWDRYDGTNAPDGCQGEDIHMELNRRGCGDYCAV